MGNVIGKQKGAIIIFAGIYLGEAGFYLTYVPYDGNGNLD